MSQAVSGLLNAMLTLFLRLVYQDILIEMTDDLGSSSGGYVTRKLMIFSHILGITTAVL